MTTAKPLEEEGDVMIAREKWFEELRGTEIKGEERSHSKRKVKARKVFVCLGECSLTCLALWHRVSLSIQPAISWSAETISLLVH